ncbi:alpha/beta fold hydrolase [Fangia hongkongensis]|uniref:alpha/beta fold hydrolase n=1 Tax=Fangia hongkongensis TaxID=270495 RepID=UPI00037250C3|nr:alpha/beta fold hydrolase [Fangia hongkongensis]MBK2124468.1 alpha/beta fold hydrolase [Fangia hongkongensis]
MILSITKKAVRKDRVLCVYHNEISQNKKTLLFIHNLGGSAINYQLQFREFSNRYNIIAYDLLGHGQSAMSKSAKDYALHEQMLDVKSIIDHFSLRHVIVVADGFGALIALLLADRNQKLIDKLLLINPERYEPVHDIPWYMKAPVSFLYRFFFVNKAYLSEKGNNNLYFPRFFVLKDYLLAKLNLPRLKSARTQIKVKTVVLRSVDWPSYKKAKVDDFYQLFFRAKIKPLESSSRYPALQASTRVNYFINQYIDELNIRAFRNLVFEGAGVRGIAYSGAITALESLGVLENIHRYAGTSAGGIYAIFLAVGYNAKEIEEIVRNINYAEFTDASRNFLSNSTRLLTDYGWYKGDAFVEYMRALIEKKTGDGEISFSMLKARTGKDLYITGTNLSHACAEVYSAESTPDMSLTEAIRISTAIPMFFKAIKRKNGKEEDILVDGGLSWNCPLELFDQRKYVSNELNITPKKTEGKNICFNVETLGFRLDPKNDPLKGRREPREYKKISNIFDFTREFMRFYSEGSLKRHLDPNNWQRVIFVDTLEVEGTNFNIDREGIDRLIEQGKSGVYKHFAWRMSENGVKFPQ